jgi:2-polyprenyl-6-methoxyphenol hydroxylase-like FAD-dependent oxidoreductase
MGGLETSWATVRASLVTGGPWPLDALLVDAAVECGVELIEDFSVSDVLRSGDRVSGVVGQVRGGSEVALPAQVVVGADGLRSPNASPRPGTVSMHPSPGSTSPTGVGLVISPRSPRMEEFYRQAVEQPATIARIFGVLGGSIPMRELVSR